MFAFCLLYVSFTITWPDFNLDFNFFFYYSLTENISVNPRTSSAPTGNILPIKIPPYFASFVQNCDINYAWMVLLNCIIKESYKYRSIWSKYKLNRRNKPFGSEHPLDETDVFSVPEKNEKYCTGNFRAHYILFMNASVYSKVITSHLAQHIVLKCPVFWG